MKKLSICLSTIALLLIGLSMHVAAATDISVEVDGKAVVFTDAKPFIDANGRTLVPLRPIADAMHMSIEWDAASRKATFKKIYIQSNSPLYYDPKNNGNITHYISQNTVTFTIDSKTASCVGIWSPFIGTAGSATSNEAMKDKSETISMDTAAIIVDGRTYAPVRYLVEAVGEEVTWDAARNTVVISALFDEAASEPPVTKPPVTEPPVQVSGKTLADYNLYADFDHLGSILIFYGQNYTGDRPIKKATINSITVNGIKVNDNTITPTNSFTYFVPMDYLVFVDFEWPKEELSKPRIVKFTAILEYTDGSKVSVNDEIDIEANSGV